MTEYPEELEGKQVPVIKKLEESDKKTKISIAKSHVSVSKPSSSS